MVDPLEDYRAREWIERKRAKVLLPTFADRVAISPFAVTDRFGQEWGIEKQMEVSANFHPVKGCALTGIEVLEMMGGNLLNLSSYVALLALAEKYFQSEVPSGVPEETVSGAVQFTLNRLHQAFCAQRFGQEESDSEHYHGLWMRDQLWVNKMDVAVGKADVCWVYDANVARHRKTDVPAVYYSCSADIKVPISQGFAVKTEKGYLDPKTGFPYCTEPDNGQGKPFIERAEEMVLGYLVEQKILNEENLAKVTPLIEKGRSWEVPFIIQHLVANHRPFHRIEKSKLGGLMELLRPELRYSHGDENTTLVDKEGICSVMVGKDDYLGNPLVISLDSLSMPQCGVVASLAKNV